MIENGHFHELQSIIDMLPGAMESVEGRSSQTQSCVTVSNFQRKKRQTLVFSATIALSADFRKKLKRGSIKTKLSDDLNSIEKLSERAGMRPTAAIFDLTNASIMADRLEESFIEYGLFPSGILVSHNMAVYSVFHSVINACNCKICLWYIYDMFHVYMQAL